MLTALRRISRTCRIQSPTSGRWSFAAICLIITFIAAIIDQLIGAGPIHRYRNFYFAENRMPITVLRSVDGLNIAILVVILNQDNAEDYRLAKQSMQCYAEKHRYERIVVDVSTNQTLKKLCPHKDFMFLRHCVTVQILADSPHIDWLLFVDADIGVVNPNRLIEQYIDPRVDLIFYDRIFNFEIMAGSYLVRNTNYTRYFLRYWADYEFKLPSSVHGTDNGAIQTVFMDMLLTDDQATERDKCIRIWNSSRDYHDLYVFEACARQALSLAPGGIWPGRVRILPKGQAWSRDGWLTGSMWSPKLDFMFHGWQMRRMDRLGFASWPSPFTVNVFNMSLCNSDKASDNWRYKDTFIRRDLEIEKWIATAIAAAHRDFRRALREIGIRPKSLKYNNGY